MAPTKHGAGIEKARTQERCRRVRRVLHLSILGAIVGWLPRARALPPDAATVTYGPQVPPALSGYSLWPEDVCAENPRKYGTEEDVQLPTARLADF